MLEVSKLSYAWPGEDAVIENISFRLGAGEKVVLLGPNGCGKSTLLRLLNGLLFAEQGEIHWQGQRLDRDALRQRDFARHFRCNNTLLLQHPEALQDKPTVRDEIASGARQLGLDDVDGRVQHWADELILTPQLDLPLIALSGGQRQKMALACQLVLDPKLMLLDEPSAALDPHTNRWLVDTMLASDKTVLISTNDLSFAREFGNRALVMSEAGKLLYDGSLSTALTDLDLLEAAGLAHPHLHHHKNDAS